MGPRGTRRQAYRCLSWCTAPPHTLPAATSKEVAGYLTRGLAPEGAKDLPSKLADALQHLLLPLLPSALLALGLALSLFGGALDLLGTLPFQLCLLLFELGCIASRKVV